MLENLTDNVDFCFDASAGLDALAETNDEKYWSNFVSSSVFVSFFTHNLNWTNIFATKLVLTNILSDPAE